MATEFPDYDVIARLRGLPLESRQLMAGNVSGRHRSSHRGASVEFAEYRKYAPGDDTRRLDWKAYARSDRYYIKEFEADTNLRAQMLIDASGSMGFKGEDERTKLEYAYGLSSILAHLLVMQGDAVGLTLSRGRNPVFIPPSRRPAHLKALCDTMRETRPEGETSLLADVHEMAERLPQRSMVVIASDLFVDMEEWAEALGHLKYRKHDVVVFHLMNAMEIEFRFDRPMRFVDMEGRSSLVADPAIMRDEYVRAVSSFMEEAEHVCRKAPVEYHLVRTSDDVEGLLREFLIKRQARKGGR